MKSDGSRVSFDSNVWEEVFSPKDTKYEPIRLALKSKQILGFICEAGFRIEAIRKNERTDYFGKSHIDVRTEIIPRDGQPTLQLSIGPKDDDHPGLPSVQNDKLQLALQHNIKLLRGLNWMWLPLPLEIRDSKLFVAETKERQHDREQRQIDVFYAIRNRGVGLGVLDALGGWEKAEATNAKKYNAACAEWADGEFVAAHFAYENDLICTNDRARSAGKSIFDQTSRVWLKSEYGAVFVTPDQLTEIIK